MIENNMINKKMVTAATKAAIEVASPGGCQTPNAVVDVDSPDDIIVKDLLPRIPYHVKVECGLSTPYTLSGLNPNEAFGVAQVISPRGIPWDFRIDCIKPYLRSYSSLTDSEKEEYEELKEDLESGEIKPWKCLKFLEWCYKHHLDINDLIETGLAIEAPDGMYDIV